MPSTPVPGPVPRLCHLAEGSLYLRNVLCLVQTPNYGRCVSWGWDTLGSEGWTLVSEEVTSNPIAVVKSCTMWYSEVQVSDFALSSFPSGFTTHFSLAHSSSLRAGQVLACRDEFLHSVPTRCSVSSIFPQVWSSSWRALIWRGQTNFLLKAKIKCLEDWSIFLVTYSTGMWVIGIYVL